jgi:hypothetical protein
LPQKQEGECRIAGAEACRRETLEYRARPRDDA